MADHRLVWWGAARPAGGARYGAAWCGIMRLGSDRIRRSLAGKTELGGPR